MMMDKVLTFAMMALLSLGLQAQTLIIANNNAGAPAGANVFTGTTALQDAIGYANDNDIIYVVPSTTNYGAVIVDKKLTIFGIGINPQKDISILTTVNNFSIRASDVRISGFEIISNIQISNGAVPSINNVLIENCIFGDYLSANSTLVNGLIVRNNIFTGSSASLLLTTSPLAQVLNNIFVHTSNIRAVDASNVEFTYNLFCASQNIIFGDIDNCLFEHNIFYGTRVDSVAVATGFNTSVNNTWNYNLAFGNSQDSYNVFYIGYDGNTGTGNIESVAGSYDPLFVNLPLFTYGTWTNSYDITLQPGSPALAGSPVNPTTEDIGPSGGLTPFDSDGTLLPYIQSINIPVVIPVGNDLPVNIKAKGN